MNQEIQPLFEVGAMKVALGRTPDPEVTALPKRRDLEPRQEPSMLMRSRANLCVARVPPADPYLRVPRERAYERVKFAGEPDFFTASVDAQSQYPRQRLAYLIEG